MGYFRFDKPKSIKSALDDFMDHLPQKTKLRQGMVLSVFNETVGSRIAEQCRDIHFEQDKLVVRVSHPTWRNEIHASRYSIKKRLNEAVKHEVIKEMIVRA